MRCQDQFIGGDLTVFVFEHHENISSIAVIWDEPHDKIQKEFTAADILHSELDEDYVIIPNWHGEHTIQTLIVSVKYRSTQTNFDTDQYPSEVRQELPIQDNSNGSGQICPPGAPTCPINIPSQQSNL